ncbi:MAG: hypothetical protein NW237_12290 [Cyanobacteriota bacterium]|nr:hypothetical protein [Cyanobacteriota bacterium]
MRAEFQKVGWFDPKDIHKFVGILLGLSTRVMTEYQDPWFKVPILNP